MPRSTVKDEVVALVVEMLCRRLHKFQIKQRLAMGNSDPKVGPVFDPIVKHWTVERYLSLARERMRGALDATVQERVAQSLEFYEAIIRDPKAALRDKMFAQERIDKLLGLELRIAPIDASTKPPKPDDTERPVDVSRLSTDELRQLDQLRRRLGYSTATN